MLSRRSARIKVMQMLYAVNRDQDIKLSETKRQYWNKIGQSKELLLFALYNIIQVSKASIDDEEKRKNKYLPSEEDKVFSSILFHNDSIQKLVKQKDLQAQFKKLHFAEKIDKDIINKIYVEFSKEDAYKAYVASDHSGEETEKILLELFKFCRASENFIETLEDQYVNWEDDKSIIIGTIKKVLKALRVENTIDLSTYDPDDETIKDFGENLLIRTFEEDDALLEQIKPVLNNWDSDRVAIIDLIFLKMALCELVHFETIPTKVTLNEYVELAKLYSTPKSKEFINGILDTLVAELSKSKVISKSGRGLIE